MPWDTFQLYLERLLFQCHSEELATSQMAVNQGWLNKLGCCPLMVHHSSAVQTDLDLGELTWKDLQGIVE